MRIQSRRAVWVGVLLVFAGALAGKAQPHLVADLNQESVDSPTPPSWFGSVEHDGVLYFSASDPSHGYEVWRTDGTFRLMDLCPGRCSGGVRTLGFFRGFLYFLGDDREHGLEIWRTDGTVGGEELLADVCPGTCGTVPSGWVEWRDGLWFLAQESFDADAVLWTSDGTAAGTRPVANLCTDLSICRSDPDDSQAVLAGPDPSGQGLLLWTFKIDEPRSLFRTDGTVGGTVLLHHFVAGFQFEGQIGRAPAGPLYFLDGLNLWTSDGTPAGTLLVRNLDGLIEVGFLLSTEVVDGIFHATFSDNNWLRSDGTAEGTFVLAQVAPGTDPTIARIGGSVFVLTTDGIWRTAGTPETTSSFAGPRGEILSVVERPGRLFVMSYDPDQNRPFLWTTDGTPAGTRRLPLGPGPRLDADGMAAFRDGVLVSRGSRELLRVDGTGAERLHDLQPGNGSAGPNEQIVLGHRLVFFSLAGEHNSQLFSSDGTAAGTTAIGAAFGGQTQFKLTRAGGRGFFNSRGLLWATDGTREGTRSWRPQSSFYESFGMNAPIGFVGGRFVFSATLDINEVPHCAEGDSEPWVSDGIHGPNQLLNLNPFFFEPHGLCSANDVSSSPGPGVVVGPLALFAADDLVHGRELFATDGTKEGTRLVADINPKRQPFDHPDLLPHPLHFVGEDSDPTDLVRAGSRAFFVADDGTTGRELWVTNGTRRGTRRVADFVPGPGSSSPHNLVAVGKGIYFFAAHGEGEGLFKSDGTRSGTVLVSDLAGVSQARDLTVVRDKLFFVAFRPETGTELWTSQGTAATTRQVADLRPGPRGSAPQSLKGLDDGVIFAADDGIAGLEPWTSDGTPEGTIRRGDLAPGRDASSPGPFSIANGQILFGADDGEHGRELWAIPVAELVN
ncbi:MAG TPA: ELWxxDGT repeat protein [Thermoanaerobaculia bacterium]|nr:ELWxxDGT repeat protein [Thermoanaerobaculia bacterium]